MNHDHSGHDHHGDEGHGHDHGPQGKPARKPISIPVKPAATSVAVAAPTLGTKLLKDPVCGMNVTEQSPHRAVHEGKTYYFCCGGCKTKFEAAPAKYLAPKPTGGHAGHEHHHPGHAQLVTGGQSGGG